MRNAIPNSTSNILHCFIQDSTATTGAGLAGLTYASSGLTAYYVTEGAATATSITLADISTLGTYISGGFKEFDSTNMPGIYEIHLPNAIYSAGADNATIVFKGATNMAQLNIGLQFVSSLSHIGATIATAIPELTGVPSATPNILDALMFLYMKSRNKEQSSQTEQEIYNDGGTKILEHDQSTVGAGATLVYTKGKVRVP